MKHNHLVRHGRIAVAGLMILAMTTVAIPSELPSVSEASVRQSEKNRIPIAESASGTFLTGESRTLTIKKVKKKSIKKLTVKSSKKSVASVKTSGKKKILIQSKKPGKATVSITLRLKNKKVYELAYAVRVADTVDRDVPVFRVDGKKNYQLKLRFYAETPHIPYIKMTTYYEKITEDKKLSVEKKTPGEYLLTVPAGVTASVNTDTDELTADRFEVFKKVTTPSEGGSLTNSSYGGAPFVQPLDDRETRPSATVTLRFSDYGLDLRGEDNDIWLPIETAANLFVSDYGASMYYTGNRVYHISDESQSDEMVTAGYLEDYLAQYPGGTRSADAAEYTYRELAFLLDTQWGDLGRSYFSDAIRDKGFDRALSETDDTTRGLQKLLKSTSMSEYLLALGILHDMLFDGGHTSIAYYAVATYRLLVGRELTGDEYVRDLQELADTIGYTVKNIPNPLTPDYNNLINNRPWADGEYREQGDTAVFTFDGFTVDSDAWNNYYDNGGEIPDDTYGVFMKCLNQASKSDKIKNFVIDLTCNRGGDDNVVAAMMSIMANDPNLYITCTATGRMYYSPFKVDRNLDGKFDEKDDAVHYPFRFAILTNKISYSCGNLLPCYAKANGIMVIGERSGGGACAVTGLPMGDGLFCRLSTMTMLLDKNGKEVDGGAEPDVALEIKKNADGTCDYSTFFDIPSLSSYINAFYAA